MTQEGTLTALREGERARVAALLTEGGMRRRMQDIGLIEGTEVECVQKSPAGDPVAYRIRAYRAAGRGLRARAGHGLLKGWGERGWD